MYKYIFTFIFTILILTSSILSSESRRDYLVYYDDPNWPSGSSHDSVLAVQRAWIVERFEFGIGQKVEAGDTLRAYNPDFGWYFYNSLQDNYVKNSNTNEHDWITTAAESLGIDPEEMYLHYIDDTYQTLGGITIFIKGYPNGSASSLAEARIPCYYNDTSRIVCNYSTPEARRLYIGYVKHLMSNYAVDVRGGVANSYYSGISWDNAAPALWNMGSIQSGGHVREHPTNIRIDSIRSLYGGVDWWYQANMKPFLQELMDTLANSSNWMPNNSEIKIILNIVGDTDVRLTEDNVSYMLFQEFSPSISRSNESTFQPFYANDSAAEVNGVNVLYSPAVRTDNHTLSESLHGNLAWFYISRSDSALFFQQKLNGPSIYGYDTLIWCGSMDINIGQPKGKHVLAQSGTDGVGYSYKIRKREYDNALVLLRTRGGGSQVINSSTDVDYALGGTYYEVYPNGTIGPGVTTTKMRNAQGRIFLIDPSIINPPSESIPLDTVLDFGAQPDLFINGSVKLSWTSTRNDAREGTATSYTIKHATEQITIGNWNSSITTTYQNPPTPDSAGSPESSVISGLTPGQEYSFGILASDEVGNYSDIVTTSGFARGILTPRISNDTIIHDLPNLKATLYAETVNSYLNIVYEFQLSTDSFFNTNYTELDNNSTGSYASVTFLDLLEDIDYYCRVRAKSVDESVFSGWSSNNISFNLNSGFNNLPPSTPELYSPQDGDSTTILTPNLIVVNSIDAEGDILTYDFELYNFDITVLLNSGYNIAEANQRTSWNVETTLTLNSTYSWRARAFDGLLYSEWSDYATFAVAQLSAGVAGPSSTIMSYPNPVSFQQGETVSFVIGDEPTDILIQSISGSRILLVRDVTNIWEWDGRNSSGSLVALGTYLWYSTENRGFGKIVVK